jgi:voltage-gated potassium channel
MPVIDERRSRMRAYNCIEAALVFLGLGALFLTTMDDVSARIRELSLLLVGAVTLCAAGDWIVRAASWRRVGSASLNRWLSSRSSVVGLLSFVPIVLALPFGWNAEAAPLLAVFWVLRFARYSKGMDMLFAVLARERESVLGVLFLFFSILLMCAVAAYFLEHRVQPRGFGSIPLALWWTITTLTTTGYGDVVPITPAGRMLAGFMMITGIIVFGLLAGVLATGFSQELRRQEFLRNWGLIKQVPIFREIGSAAIADLAGLLRAREIPARTVLCRRGDPGNAMYFIVSGMVEVLIEPRKILGPGEFFGEISLVTDQARTATVVTTRASQLLILDIADFRALAATRPGLMHSIEAEARRRLEEAAATS